PTGPADYRLRQPLAEFTGLSGLTPNPEVALVKRSAVVLTDERLQSQDRSARASARRVRAGATAAAMPAGDQIARDRGGRGCRSPQARHVRFRTLACMDLRAKLGWSYSCTLTSGSWRHRWRWPGSSRRVGSQIASMRVAASATGSPGSAARRRVCRILS